MNIFTEVENILKQGLDEVLFCKALKEALAKNKRINSNRLSYNIPKEDINKVSIHISKGLDMSSHQAVKMYLRNIHSKGFDPSKERREYTDLIMEFYGKKRDEIVVKYG